MDAVRGLDRKLFEAYIERRADPIAGSLEPGIYAGYFDWRDCQTPTGTQLPCADKTAGNHRQQPLTDPGRIIFKPLAGLWDDSSESLVSNLCSCGSHVSCVKYGSLMTYCKHH